MNKLKALWGSLPHPVQAMLIAAGTAGGTALLHSLAEGGLTAVNLKHSLALSLGAAVAVVRAFYMVPNRPAQPEQAQAAKAGQ